MYTPDDLARRVLQKQLAREIGLPYVDVDVALATTHYIQVRNARLYRAEEAFKALEAHYARRIADNTAQYRARNKDIFRRRAETCQARLDRVRKYAEEWRKDHE